MSRTRRTKSTTRWWLKESTEARRQWHRRLRHQCKKLVMAEKYDQVPVHRGTEGWLTF